MKTRNRPKFYRCPTELTLIERGLSLELEGEVRVDFDPSGLICTMEIPLAAAWK